jgi:hypothetical protein
MITFNVISHLMVLVYKAHPYLLLFSHSTYMRVFNFGQNIDSKMIIRLIRGSTYTRVYTVMILPNSLIYITNLLHIYLEETL